MTKMLHNYVLLFITECPITQQIADFSGVTASLDNVLINRDDLFTFEDENFVYCAPTANGSPITLTITFPEPLILLEIAIRGDDGIIFDEYVSSFSLSYARNGIFIPYIRDTGSAVCILYLVCCSC